MSRRRFFRFFFKALFILACFAILLCVIFLAPLDRRHYKETTYYKSTLSGLDSIPAQPTNKGTLKAGWAKVNITPAFPLPIASYGIRNDFDKVHDSIWCRTFVFNNGIHQSALVTLDLLIFPPALVNKLKVELPKVGFTLENTFLSTSHTHNGPGGWAEGLGGRFLAGKYKEEYVDQLSEAIITSIKAAGATMEEASMGFAKYEAKKYVFNRLSVKEEDVDHWLRVLKVKKRSGLSAALVTYAAHPNVLSSKIDHISGDYAGALVDSLERNEKIDFAAFCAGAVGAHRCRIGDEENYEFIGIISSYLNKKIISNFETIVLKDSVVLKTMKVPVYLGEPQLRVSKEWKIRSWLFKFLFGEQDVYLSAMELGDAVLIGTPCDFSGELIKEFSHETSDKKVNLVVTGFNGGYIGYIIPDKHYSQIERREAREMNWYGPHSGAYFTEIIKAILRKI